MNKLVPLLGLMALACLLSACGESSPLATGKLGATQQFIIKLQDARTQSAPLDEAATADLERAGAIGLDYVRRLAGGAHLLRSRGLVTRSQAQAAAERLARLPQVRYAVLDERRYAAATPNDPLFPDQWHYQPPEISPGGANLPAAWDIGVGDPALVIAVLDSGLLPHVDLDNNLLDSTGRVAPGLDFISAADNALDGDGRDANPVDVGDGHPAGACGPDDPGMPSSWHGTHVAGTIAALSNNGIGVAGVIWTGRVQPLRVLGVCGGSDSDIFEAMLWAGGFEVPGLPPNPTPARVLNLSIAGPGGCPGPYQEAINALVSSGVTVVIAAGNAGADAAGFSPGNCDGVITVHAHTVTGQAANYSNFGRSVEISGPGGQTELDGGVLSTYDSGQTAAALDGTSGRLQGTSMAAPHVAGIAGLLLAANPALTPAQIGTILQATARPFPYYENALDCNTERCGAGMVDAAAALRAAVGNN